MPDNNPSRCVPDLPGEFFRGLPARSNARLLRVETSVVTRHPVTLLETYADPPSPASVVSIADSHSIPVNTDIVAPQP